MRGRPTSQTVIKVGPNPDGSGAREVTVVPVGSENGLRNLAWIEGNRRKVSEMTGGRVAYVYLPNTSGAGYTNFNRYFFAQIDKDAAVIDERFNGGGTAADYIIDYMRRPLMNYWATREGADFSTPVGAIFGPKVMIIDEYAGSGGDALPWYFQAREDRAARRQADVGRPGRHLRLPARSSTAARSPRRASPSTAPRAAGRSRTSASRPTSRSS